MEYYRLKEIIIGLRDEYKKNEKRLESLKKFINVNDDAELDTCDFYAFKHGKDKYIEFVIKARQSFIVSLLEQLQNKLIKKDNMKTIPLSRGYHDEYTYLLLPREELYRIDKSRAADLYCEADALLKTDFINNIARGKIKLPEKDFDISFSPSGIIARANSYDTQYPPAGFIYSAKDDEMIITAYDDYLYKEHINNIFNIKIPAEKLNEAKRNAIESSYSLRKEFVVEGAEVSKTSQVFKVEDINSSTIGLVRKKKKR